MSKDLQKPYPILFVHEAFDDGIALPDYLACALAQAKASNPESLVILLSSIPFKFISGIEALDVGVMWAPFNPYWEDVSEFRKRYVHLSNLPLPFERFCMERWFMIRRFVEAHALERLAYLDSDMLMYSDIREAARPFCDADVAMLDSNWATAVFHNPSVIKTFCEMIFDVYLRKGGVWEEVFEAAGLREPWDEGSEGGYRNNISDMWYAGIFQRIHPEVRCAQMHVITDGTAFDRNINCHDDIFEHDGTAKKLTWRFGLPMVKHLPTDALIRLHCLHFQGIEQKPNIKSVFLEHWPEWQMRLRPPGAEPMLGMPAYVQGLAAIPAVK